MSDDVDEAVATAVKQIASLSLAIHEAREPTSDEVNTALNGAMTLLYVSVTSLAKLAHHVGKLAEKDQTDFDTAVEQTAEALAEQKLSEKPKRNFIGKP